MEIDREAFKACFRPWHQHVACAVAQAENGPFRRVEQGKCIIGLRRNMTAADPS